MLHYYLAVLFLIPWTALGVSFAIVSKLLNPGGQIAHQVGRVWSWGILKISGMNLKVKGLENIKKEKQYIFLANHTSAYDIPAVYWVLPNKLGMLAKKQLRYIPFFGWAMWAAGHFFVDRHDHRKAIAVMDQVAKLMAKNRSHSLVIFPEGTRTLDGQLQRFKKGAFILSLDTGIPVVPVIINGGFKAKSKRSHAIVPTTLDISILPPVDPGAYSRDTRQQFLDDVHQTFEDNYIPPSAAE